MVMKVPPRFLKGAYYSALRMVMIESETWTIGPQCGETVARVEVPFSRPKAVCCTDKPEGERFVAFAEGRWMELWRECVTIEENAREIPTGPIPWEREGPMPNLSFSWVSCLLHCIGRSPLRTRG